MINMIRIIIPFAKLRVFFNDLHVLDLCMIIYVAKTKRVLFIRDSYAIIFFDLVCYITAHFKYFHAPQCHLV